MRGQKVLSLIFVITAVGFWLQPFKLPQNLSPGVKLSFMNNMAMGPGIHIRLPGAVWRPTLRLFC